VVGYVGVIGRIRGCAAGKLTGNLEFHLAAKAASRVDVFIVHRPLLPVVLIANA
jgi:hypothetical protein